MDAKDQKSKPRTQAVAVQAEQDPSPEAPTMATTAIAGGAAGDGQAANWKARYGRFAVVKLPPIGLDVNINVSFEYAHGVLRSTAQELGLEAGKEAWSKIFADALKAYFESKSQAKEQLSPEAVEYIESMVPASSDVYGHVKLAADLGQLGLKDDVLSRFLFRRFGAAKSGTKILAAREALMAYVDSVLLKDAGKA